MQLSTILIYKKDPEICQAIKGIVRQSGWSPYICESVPELRHTLATKFIQAFILDVTGMPEACRILQKLHALSPGMYSIVITGTPTVREAVLAMKMGTLDYLSYNSLPSNLPKLLEELRQKIHTREQFTATSLQTFQESAGLIGVSNAFQQVLLKAQTASHEDENILITGKSGTGKELLAMAIHDQSQYGDGPFIPVNCGAFPEHLVESELFGHLQGAYTGAEATSEGFFQAAQGGTLFLDEIANTSHAMQAKLLRVLEDKEVWKVGARRPDRIDVRLIAASNTPLQKLVQEGQFRQDLYYRLRVLSIHIPPLRNRKEDILPLCHHFAQQWGRKRGVNPPSFTDKVLAHLLAYNWPGNVRELKHLVTELSIFSRGEEITLDILPPLVRSSLRNREDNPISLEVMEKDHIHATCTQTQWNITLAAKLLGITRQALYRKLHQYQLGTY